MGAAPKNDLATMIAALPIWHGQIEIAPLPGGMTNRNFLVRDAGRRFVVRLGGDIPEHGVLRFNEHAASRAAAAAGISPQVHYAGDGVLVLAHIDGRTLTAGDVRADRRRCLDLVRRVHSEVAAHLRGPVLAFNVFHVIRDYLHRLEGNAVLAAAAVALEAAAGPDRVVLAHNDLLAGNFIDDGARLWLLDWDYAGFNTPLFDLAGLSSNNGFGAEDDVAMLAAYFGRRPSATLRRRFQAMLCASLLRETLWSMVSERLSTLDFDYAGYTATNRARFDQAWAAFNRSTP